ncbi:MAG: hypothetical protein IV100_10945 [Myxococcales bacterium]|nr:hypothetical protein [Myxococcales bacterium]
MNAPRPAETDLYAPVKAFLTERGFDVKGEVRGCDLVALHGPGGEGVAVVELKLGFNLELVLQAVERLSVADEVWLAIPITGGRGSRSRDSRVRTLCRLLGLGLLGVHATTAVEVLVEPAPYAPRRNRKERSRLVTEHQRRRGDPTAGGSTRQPIMTAYRQSALACAEGLAEGPARPRDLAARVPQASAVLQRNVYGWFERVSRGLYALTETGRAALRKSLSMAITTSPHETEERRTDHE